MTVPELIRSRRSVRTFDGTPLSPEVLTGILDFAQRCGNPFDLPIAWRILDEERDGLSSPVIVGSHAWIAGKMNAVPHAEEAFGYAFERILLHAWSLGIGSTGIAGTMDRAAFERAMELGPGEVMPCVSPLGTPAARMSFRETMMRKGIRADTRMDFGQLFFDGSFEKPLTPESAGIFMEPLELVRCAPSAVNKQPWRAVKCGDTLHFFEKRDKAYISGSGWDIRKIDMGIALCQCAMGLEEAGYTPVITLDDPAIPAPPDTVYIASCTAEKSS